MSRPLCYNVPNAAGAHEDAVLTAMGCGRGPGSILATHGFVSSPGPWLQGSQQAGLQLCQARFAGAPGAWSQVPRLPRDAPLELCLLACKPGGDREAQCVTIQQDHDAAGLLLHSQQQTALEHGGALVDGSHWRVTWELSWLPGVLACVTATLQPASELGHQTVGASASIVTQGALLSMLEAGAQALGSWGAAELTHVVRQALCLRLRPCPAWSQQGAALLPDRVQGTPVWTLHGSHPHRGDTGVWAPCMLAWDMMVPLSGRTFK